MTLAGPTPLLALSFAPPALRGITDPVARSDRFQRLSARKLVETGREGVRAVDALFGEPA